VDTSVTSLWLGHESVETTQIYLHADLSIKERAVASTAPPDVNPGRYRASDSDVACGVERNRDARLGHQEQVGGVAELLGREGSDFHSTVSYVELPASRRSPPSAGRWVSYIRTATTTPDAAVIAATVQIAA